jgi:hypothetical protein
MLFTTGRTMARRQTLKIPKNPRKFNIWESNGLNEILQNTHQLLANMDTLSIEQDLHIHELGTMNMPIHLLYDICEAYGILYNKLLKEQLLITANPIQNNNYH